MSEKKQKIIILGVLFTVGFLLFGTMGAVFRETLEIPLAPVLCFFLYGMMGGWLIAGIVTGVILFLVLIRPRHIVLKILVCVLFPFTWIVICYLGILGFLPYFIYCIRRR